MLIIHHSHTHVPNSFKDNHISKPGSQKHAICHYFRSVHVFYQCTFKAYVFQVEDLNDINKQLTIKHVSLVLFIHLDHVRVSTS